MEIKNEMTFQRQPGGRARRPNKYNAKKTYVDGICFDSKKEAKYYQELKVREIIGEVSHFHRQVVFDLPGGTKYRCDFMVILASGDIEYIDVKGATHTKAYRDFVRNKKQVEALYPVIIIEV